MGKSLSDRIAACTVTKRVEDNEFVNCVLPRGHKSRHRGMWLRGGTYQMEEWGKKS